MPEKVHEVGNYNTDYKIHSNLPIKKPLLRIEVPSEFRLAINGLFGVYRCAKLDRHAICIESPCGNSNWLAYVDIEEILNPADHAHTLPMRLYVDLDTKVHKDALAFQILSHRFGDFETSIKYLAAIIRAKHGNEFTLRILNNMREHLPTSVKQFALAPTSVYEWDGKQTDFTNWVRHSILHGLDDSVYNKKYALKKLDNGVYLLVFISSIEKDDTALIITVNNLGIKEVIIHDGKISLVKS